MSKTLGGSQRTHRSAVEAIARTVAYETRNLAEAINSGHCPAAALAFEDLQKDLGQLKAELRYAGPLPHAVIQKVGVAQADANRFTRIFKQTCVVGRR